MDNLKSIMEEAIRNEFSTKKVYGRNLNNARYRKDKNDEFYTQKEDIYKELGHYADHFMGKTVFCNCDDPTYSEFFRYFVMEFKSLGLRKVISTHYEKAGKSYALWYDGKATCNPKEFLSAVNLPGTIRTKYHISLKENGDFRSEECIRFLKESDIVCTNPPFPKFHEFLEQVTQYKKDFLIVANFNALGYKDVFPPIRDGKIWLGVNSGGLAFEVPKKEKMPASAVKKNGKWYRTCNVLWLTNLEHERHYQSEIPIYKTTERYRYQTYDNYNAIEVPFVKDIPSDYAGVMGVPISFLSKHNPKQFEIVGMGITSADSAFKPDKMYGNVTRFHNGKQSKGVVNPFVVLAHDEVPVKKNGKVATYYMEEGSNKYLTLPYVRVLIRHAGRGGRQS